MLEPGQALCQRAVGGFLALLLGAGRHRPCGLPLAEHGANRVRGEGVLQIALGREVFHLPAGELLGQHLAQAVGEAAARRLAAQ